MKGLLNGIAASGKGAFRRSDRGLSWLRQAGRFSSGGHSLRGGWPSRFGWCLVLLVVLVTAACGSPQAPNTIPAAPVSSAPVVGEPPLSDVRTPSVDACGLSDPWSMVETAFVGTVTAIEVRTNEGRDFTRREMGLDPVGERWPWVTFAVDRWYTHDFGTTFSMWAPGFSATIGDEWLIAGALYWVVGESYQVSEQSGEVFACLSMPATSPDMTSWDSRYGGSVQAGSGTPEQAGDPAVLAGLAAHRAVWETQAPDDYTAVVSVSDSRTVRSNECGAFGLIRVVVEGAAVVQAVDLRSDCVVTDLSTVTGIGDLFDIAAETAGALQAPIVYDPEYGYVRSFDASDRSVEVSAGADMIVTAAVRAFVGADDVFAGAEAALTRWEAAGITSYVSDVEVDCLCFISGRYQVAVTDGTVEAVQGTDGPVDLTEPGFSSFDFSVEGLFNTLSVWSGDRPEAVVAGFDPDLGHPIDLRIDPVVDMFDDELTIIVRGLTPDEDA